MKLVMSLASVFSLNLLADSKLPCTFVSFDYYSQTLIAAIGPVVVVLAVVLLSTLHAFCTHKDSNEHHWLKRAFWGALSIALFFLDVVHPMVCRTLFGFFSCRDLGEAGFWLESDHRVLCKHLENGENIWDERYSKYHGFVSFAAFVWGICVPLLFFVLIRKYELHGLRGDKLVHRALGWMYQPYLMGRSFWLPLEMCRIMMLCSFIGFLAYRCWMKPVVILQRTFVD